MQIPPPPPESQQAASNDLNVSTYAEQAAAPPASVTPSDAGTPPPAPMPEAQPTPASVSEQTQTPVAGQNGTNETNTSTETSTALPVGTMVAGRYEVVQLVSEDEQEHVYAVIDHQGYQHCWNCGSEENAEGDEFCIDCGAELLNAHYLMHEYAATTSSDNDARVLQGTIANTFVDSGKTYVIEQQHAAQIAFPNGVHLLAASDSDAGNVRRSEPNEDSTLVLQLQRVHESQATPVGVFIIADGMGGHDNGQGASRMTVNIIADKLVRELLTPPLDAEKSGGLTASVQPMEEESLIALLKGAVEDANNILVQTNQHDKTDMGSTLTGFMIVGDHAYVINVGDSRTYMLREGTLYQLTTDHSLVGQLVAGGLIEPDDVYTHPQRSQIYRSLGDKMNVQIDDFKQQLLPGDILLSCSDGLWEMVRNPQITDILNNAHDPQSACSELIDAANANGGEDNVSAAIVFVR
jgi:serine/threonine protein phosphatase PrpC